MKSQGKINKIYFNDKNSFFAGGNNIAAKLADENSTHYLLLNSDVIIKNERWLSTLYDFAVKNDCAAVSYGAVLYPPIRADGYCILIKKDLYDKYLLDENFAFFWGLTKLESQILSENKKIIAFRNHENLLHHVGGGSGKACTNAKGMDTDISQVLRWFDGKGNVQVFRSVSTPAFMNSVYNFYVHSLLCSVMVHAGRIIYRVMRKVISAKSALER